VLTVLNTGNRLEYTENLQLITGYQTLIPVSLNAAPIQDEEQHLLGAVLVFRDETGEQERTRQLQMIRHVLNMAPEKIFLSDQTGRLLFCNRKCLEWLDPSLLARSREDAADLPPGCTFFDLFPEISPSVYSAEQQVLGLEPMIRQEFKRSREDGGAGYFERSSFLVSLGEETIRCTFVQDLTDQRHLESQVFQGQKLQALGQLVGGVAHDFNNLLCGIIGYGEILERRLGDRQADGKYVRTILDTARRAASLTNQLLGFSRNRDYSMEIMDLHVCLDETIGLLRQIVDKKMILSRDFQSPSALVQGNFGQLQNAFLNLSLNARDAMPMGGELTISTRQISLPHSDFPALPTELLPGEYILVSFTDTGTGIREEIREKIFEPFYTTKKEGQGTGLGLSAVAGTVKKHQGALTVWSEPGRGAEFRLFIPLNSQPELDFQEPEAELPDNTATGTVLIVDDEEILARMLQQYLEERGFRTYLAGNGEEALTIFRRHHARIDCVILDIIMPVMDGYTALQEMKKIQPGVNVMVVSGFTGGDNPGRFLELGVRSFIHKPYRMQNLLDVLNGIILSGGEAIPEQTPDL